MKTMMIPILLLPIGCAAMERWGANHDPAYFQKVFQTPRPPMWQQPICEQVSVDGQPHQICHQLR